MLFLTLLVSPFKSKSRLEVENAALRHQMIVLQRKVRGRVHLTNSARLFFIQLYRWFPSVLEAITIVRPETLVRWHRAGFRSYWRWKSRSLGGRPQIDADLQRVPDGEVGGRKLWISWQYPLLRASVYLTPDPSGAVRSGERPVVRDAVAVPRSDVCPEEAFGISDANSAVT